MLTGPSLSIAPPALAAYKVPCKPKTEINLPDNPADPSGDSHSCCPLSSQKLDATSCLFAKYANPTVELLSIVVGIVVVFGIISGGIQSARHPRPCGSLGRALITAGCR